MAKQHGNRKWIDRMKRHYRLVIMNDENFEIKMSYKLNPLNVLLTVSSLFVIYALIIIFFIRYTPVSQFFFGPDIQAELRRQNLQNLIIIDSLQTMDAYNTQRNEILMNILWEDVDTVRPRYEQSDMIYDTIDFDEINYQDSILRLEYESKKNYSIKNTNGDNDIGNIESKYFIAPVSGIVTKEFDQDFSHFGIDIVAKEQSAIKATLDGKVIFTGWTSEFGHIITIQHIDNLVSIYMHNSVLLKKVGNFVSAGDVIALLGNSGDFSQGPHLHFELWHEMVPVNPAQYIAFNK